MLYDDTTTNLCRERAGEKPSDREETKNEDS